MKYYWLKLKKDFFQQHQIKVLKSQPNGRLATLIYLELLAESTSHEGQLRYSEKMSYTDETLGAVIDEKPEDLKQAIELLKELELVECLEDGTLNLIGIDKLIGSASNTDVANRVRRYREKQKALQNETHTVTKDNERLEIRDKRLDIKENTKRKAKLFTPPTINEVIEYCKTRNNNVDPERFIDFYQSKGWMVGKNKMKDWKAAVRTWEQREKPKEEVELTDTTGIQYDASENPIFTEERKQQLANRRKYES